MSYYTDDELNSLTESFNTSNYYEDSEINASDLDSQIYIKIDQQKSNGEINQLREDLNMIFRNVNSLNLKYKHNLINMKTISDAKESINSYIKIKEKNIENYFDLISEENDSDAKKLEVGAQKEFNEEEKINPYFIYF